MPLGFFFKEAFPLLRVHLHEGVLVCRHDLWGHGEGQGLADAHSRRQRPASINKKFSTLVLPETEISLLLIKEAFILCRILLFVTATI